MNVEKLKPYYDGKLLRRQEILLDDPTFKKLLLQKYFTPIPSIQRKNFRNQCMRCNEQKRLAVISCHLCGHEHLYCRNCVQMGRIMECEPLYYWTGESANWPKYEHPCSWDGKLTAAQQKAADRIVQAIKKREPEVLIWAVCGAGKTEMLFPGITKSLRLGLRLCIATPRADVVRELLPRLKSAFTDVPIQGLYGGSEDKDATAQFIIATTHQLLRFQQAFDVIIIDEVDAFPFHKDKSLPFAANRSKKNTAVTIYLTATPREDLKRKIAKKQLPHVFVPVRYHGKPLPIPVKKMDFSLKKRLRDFLPPESFMKWLKQRNNPNRQLLLFVPTIPLAENIKPQLSSLMLKEKIITNDHEIESVHAEDPARADKVISFREKKLRVLITTTILERGVTFPSVDVAIIDAGHDVFDEAALVQISGRAGRSPDDPTGEIVFFHDGKTEAMEQAISSIRKMNRRAGF